MDKLKKKIMFQKAIYIFVVGILAVIVAWYFYDIKMAIIVAMIESAASVSDSMKKDDE